MRPDLSFAVRAHLTELMDEPSSYEEFRDCLRDLEKVNRTVLSYRPTLRWLEQFTNHAAPLHIVDVGSGGGDTLRRIEHWAEQQNLPVRLTGIDLNPHAVRTARESSSPASRIEWLTSDAFSWRPSQPVDLIISSLFTHHLSDSEIVRFLEWMEQTAARGWFINDLSRGRISYHLFKLLARVMRWHRFVQHDGPVSILRSFTAEDWQRYIREAGLASLPIQIQPTRPGRLCVSRVK
jgi:SAM-dependent methyltransferase